MTIENNRSLYLKEERLKFIDAKIAHLVSEEITGNQGLMGRPLSLFMLEAFEFTREAITRDLPNEGRGYKRLGIVKPAEIKKVFGGNETDIIVPSYSVDHDTNRPIRNDPTSSVVVWRKPLNPPTL